MKFGIFRAHSAGKIAEEGAERRKQNAKLWVDAARATLGDPHRHNPKATVKQQEMDL
jgi:hypothetical protein